VAKDYIFKTEIWLPRPRDEVFDFFKAVVNLQQITPPWLNFRILTPLPLVIQQGTLIDYQLKLYGISFRWRTEISLWEPPYRFVDSQLSGPYRKWVHTHRFEELDGGTRMQDVVEYRLPGGPLAPIAHELFVKRNVRDIFAYRKAKILDIFGQPIKSSNPPVQQYSLWEFV
jgi:ligand-binding SRPBCC domain-containing protein